jgi:hypothetical protein
LKKNSIILLIEKILLSKMILKFLPVLTFYLFVFDISHLFLHFKSFPHPSSFLSITPPHGKAQAHTLHPLSYPNLTKKKKKTMK